MTTPDMHIGSQQKSVCRMVAIGPSLWADVSRVENAVDTTGPQHTEVALEAVTRIDALFDIEREINGEPA